MFTCSIKIDINLSLDYTSNYPLCCVAVILSCSFDKNISCTFNIQLTGHLLLVSTWKSSDGEQVEYCQVIGIWNWQTSVLLVSTCCLFGFTRNLTEVSRLVCHFGLWSG